MRLLVEQQARTYFGTNREGGSPADARTLEQTLSERPAYAPNTRRNTRVPFTYIVVVCTSLLILNVSDEPDQYWIRWVSTIVTYGGAVHTPVSYTHLTLPTNRCV